MSRLLDRLRGHTWPPCVFSLLVVTVFSARCLVDHTYLRENRTIAGAELIRAIVNKILTVVPYAITEKNTGACT